MGLKIMGTGSFLPPQEVGNDELFAYLKTRKPNGRPFDSSSLKKMFQIESRHLDIDRSDPEHWRKLPPEQGGLYETEMVLEALKSALYDAVLTARDLDAFILVSCTPDHSTQCSGHLTRLTAALQGMGMRDSVFIHHANLGCAGMAAGLELATWAVDSGKATTVAVAAVNCPSAHLALRDRYILDKPRPGYEWSHLSLEVFGDGAGVIILQKTEASEQGLIALEHRVNPKLTLVRYPAGGMENPTRADNVQDHIYLMDPEGVSEVFKTEIPRTKGVLEKQTGIALGDFDLILFHQANGRLIENAVRELNLPPEKVPICTNRHGNLAAASTLAILDAKRRAGAIGPQSKIAFLWIGAGAGAHSGCAAFAGVPAFIQSGQTAIKAQGSAEPEPSKSANPG